jgi:hypothetical protein
MQRGMSSHFQLELQYEYPYETMRRENLVTQLTRQLETTAPVKS